VFLIGGRLFKHSAVTGVHPEAGLTTADADEAAMKRLLARRAADTYVLAGEEKVGAASPFEVLPWTAVAGVITDADVDLPVPVLRAGKVSTA
jgi:DeoR/GlpR family transcriptional regulator of sugar metabolism